MSRRRRRRSRKAPASLVLLLGAAASTWWLYRAERSTAEPDPGLLAATEPQPSAPPSPVNVAALEVSEATPPAPPPKLIDPPPPPVATQPPAPDRSALLIDAGRDAISRGDKLSARTSWNEAFHLGVDGEKENFLRRELGRLAEETILSATILTGDLHAERYVIRTGDVLAKIAATNRISPDLLAHVNGITDKNLIREGQTIKVLKGPFRAVVHKGTYTLDVFLGDTFVRQYQVGLGADDSTPTGQWRVATKLVNPTYYPPRGGQIVSADDPANPLGERWIGLVGISGEAVDQQRYGIHGTNEPDSIGKSLSMGCIRMRNADVEILYAFLVETHSTVTVLQ